MLAANLPFTIAALLLLADGAPAQPAPSGLGDSLALTVRVTPSEFGPMEVAYVETILRNRTARTLAVIGQGCGSLYYQIRDARGRSYSQEEGSLGCVVDMPRSIVLSPREELRARERWTASYMVEQGARATLPEAEYRVTGTFGDGPGQLRSAPARVVIRRTDPFGAPGGVKISADIDSHGPRPGDSVRVRVTATNLTTRPITMRFRSTCPFLIAISNDRAGGVMPPRQYRSPGQTCAPRITTVRLDPRASRQAIIAWIPDWPTPLEIDTTRMSFGGRQVWGGLDFSRPLWSSVQFLVLCPTSDFVPGGRGLPAACLRR